MVLTRAEYARGIGVFHEIIAVDVGPKKQRFYVHTKLLAEGSEFFKAAIKPRWDMPGREALDLSDEDPLVFALFATWLYQSDIIFEAGFCSYREETDHMDSILIKAYGFAQRRLSSRFHDALISAFMMRFGNDANETVEPLSAINMSLLFDESSKGSALWRLMIDMTIWQTSMGKSKHIEDCQHPEFLAELCKAQALCISKQGQQGHIHVSNPACDVCKYHRHDDGESEGEKRPMYGITRDRWSIAKVRLREFNAGLEVKTFYAPEDFFTSIPQASNQACKLFYPNLDCAAIELLLQRMYLLWDLKDVVRAVCRDKSPEKDHALLMQPIHLYCIGVYREDTDLLNDTMDAIVEWAFVCHRGPSEQCLSFAEDFALQLDNKDDRNMKPLYVLAMIFAWTGEYIVSDRVMVLQVVAIAQSSLRDTRAKMAKKQQRMPRRFPQCDPSFCKWFHFHLEDGICCYDGEPYDCDSSMCAVETSPADDSSTDDEGAMY